MGALTAAIVGAGLIGRSVALAYRRHNPDARIIELDRGDSLNSLRDAELIVLATPVDVILDIIHKHTDLLRHAVVVDTGSTKRAIVQAARRSGLDTFIGGHPMAGAATSGPAAAREDLFDNRPWFLIPNPARESALRSADAFVRAVGAIPVVMTDDGTEHDRVMAAVSHLPQVIACALIVTAAEGAGERLGWAGAGLRDTTRLAASDASVWHSVLATNAQQLRPLLKKLAAQLSTIADDLEDEQAIREFFARANRARATLDQ